MQGVRGGGGGGGGLILLSIVQYSSISFPQNYISEMDTFSCINSQFMDDNIIWSLKSLRPAAGLQMLVIARACCSNVHLSACAEHAVGVVHSFSIAGTPN